MRVVAGRWRGRRLAAPRGDATRPTTDRVKEALFSILGGAVDGRHVVDLCCGAGGLGIEALSRGAAHVDFVDLSRDALAAVEANLKTCGAGFSEARLWRLDAVRWLEKHAAALPARLLLLADPPYADEAAAGLWRLFLAQAADARLEVAVLEHRPGLVLAPPPAGWACREKRYGATALTILERE